ncbi:hypothetical protein H7U19_00675 [Hyunsoonleella sp. SJ7]|uniref:Lipoprotein n=1 Tax=Hyunsoonleella aquatilis TaxID=2762758 RepID=A0A923H9M7_9FLAO|nr:hypothetical protein [Hyunsoonleella aquatilis]MBC3756896.1 hypothetical protein [Hyunsoonleella aquatilis]
MKRLNLLTVLLLSLFVLSTACCNKDDDNSTDPIDQLPPATQTGENTFGYLVNGTPISITNTREQVAIYQQGQLQFGGGGVNINIVDPLEINTQYELIGRARYQVDPNPQLGCSYQFEDTLAGVLVFSKIDRVNYIISGTFEFSTVTDNCETINITNGRFDMKYIP